MNIKEEFLLHRDGDFSSTQSWIRRNALEENGTFRMCFVHDLEELEQNDFRAALIAAAESSAIFLEVYFRHTHDPVSALLCMSQHMIQYISEPLGNSIGGRICFPRTNSQNVGVLSVALFTAHDVPELERKKRYISREELEARFDVEYVGTLPQAIAQS